MVSPSNTAHLLHATTVLAHTHDIAYLQVVNALKAKEALRSTFEVITRWEECLC
eukprot:m.104103 g.104103  ORF g.104103 m.104103 type:complete len:54 (-) comp13253_c1_seq4:978-1139(-)